MQNNGSIGNDSPGDISDGARSLGQPVHWPAVVLDSKTECPALTWLASDSSGTHFDECRQVVCTRKPSIRTSTRNAEIAVSAPIPTHALDVQRGVPRVARPARL